MLPEGLCKFIKIINLFGSGNRNLPAESLSHFAAACPKSVYGYISLRMKINEVSDMSKPVVL